MQVDVYAFSMIAYELFEGAIPFEHLHPVEAARRAAMNHARPVWGKTCNRSVLRILHKLSSLTELHKNSAQMALRCGTKM